MNCDVQILSKEIAQILHYYNKTIVFKLEKLIFLKGRTMSIFYIKCLNMQTYSLVGNS